MTWLADLADASSLIATFVLACIAIGCIIGFTRCLWKQRPSRRP